MLAIILVISQSLAVAAIGIWRGEIVTAIIVTISSIITTLILGPEILANLFIKPGSYFDSGVFATIGAVVSFIMWAIIIDLLLLKYGQKDKT